MLLLKRRAEFVQGFAVDQSALAHLERRQLARILREQELTASSLFDADNIAELGQMLGIDALVTGSIADLGASVKINARAISV